VPYVFFGILALLLLLLAARGFVTADPKVLARAIKTAGGLICLGLALIFALTGRWFFAMALGAFGIGLLTGRRVLPGFGGMGGLGGMGPGPRSAGQTSTVRAVYLEMNPDHDSGMMNGRLLAGSYDGA